MVVGGFRSFHVLIMTSQEDEIPGSQNFSQKFHRNQGSFKLRRNMRCLLRNVKRFQKLTWSFSKQILRAWAHHDVARLSMFLISLPGTVSKGLMPGSQKFSPKCHQMVP